MADLLVSCVRGNSALVSRQLEAAEVDLNYRDEKGRSGAYWACRNGRTQCVRILAGADNDRVDWNQADWEGFTPLFWALSGNHSDIVNLICEL